jgi:hypothetical protein
MDDLMVLPPHLRHIYTDSIPESSSQTSSVVFLERPVLINSEEDCSKVQCPAVITDYFGNPLEWTPRTSSFTPAEQTHKPLPPAAAAVTRVANIATFNRLPVAIGLEEVQLETELQTELEIELQKHGGADALIQKITTMEGLDDWDRLARYALKRSSFSQQSSTEFCKTLDESLDLEGSTTQEKMERIREKERKLVQIWLAIRGDKILVD